MRDEDKTKEQLISELVELRQQLAGKERLQTQYKQTEETIISNLSTIFDYLNAVIYVADMKTYEILFVNKYGKELFGTDIIGKPCFKVFHVGQARPCSFCTNDQLVRDGKLEPSYIWEFLNTKTGQWFKCIDKAIPWSDGRLVRMEIAVNINEIKNTEDELRKHRDHLEGLVNERTVHLQTALAQLQQEMAERELVEQALQEQLRFSQQLIDTIPNPIFYKDKKGLFLGCNAAFEAYIGLTKEEIIGKSVYDIAPRDLADKYHEMDSLLFSEPGVQVYESSVLYADDTIHNVIFNKATFLNTDGNVAGLVGVIIDITERKQAEEALRESEERYRRLVDLSPDKISVLSEGKIVFINNAGAELLGVESPEELIGKPMMDIIHPDYKKIVKERIRQIEEEGKTAPLLEEKLIRLDGTVIDVEVTAVPFTFQGKPAVQAIARDITQRKRVEEALEAERRRLFSLLDGLPALVYLQAPDYSIRFSNLYFWERFGKPGKKPCYEVFHGREEPCKECPTFRIFDTKSPREWEGIEPDGRTYQFNTYPFSDIDGSPLALVLGIDITDRKQAEAALRLSEKRFSKAFNTSPNPMVISTFTDGRYRRLSS